MLALVIFMAAELDFRGLVRGPSLESAGSSACLLSARYTWLRAA